MRSPAWRFLGWTAFAGAAVALVLFAAESASILQDGAAGVQISVRGPFAALFASVKPLLPALLFRVAGVYVVGGAALGMFAGALVLALNVSAPRRWSLWLLELTVVSALLLAAKAIERPALLDDVAFFRRLLGWLVNRGQPWQPRWIGGLWVAAHVVVASSRWRRVAFQRIAVAAAAVVAVPLVAVALQFAESGRSRPQPLFVLIGIDALRPDRLKAFGADGRVAPHLEEFLAEATLFSSAYTSIAQTEPAWRTLVTARWPHRTGVRYPLTAESRWEPLATFPAAFTQGGYQTEFETDCSRFNFQGPASGFESRIQPPRGAVNFLLEKLRYRTLGVLADNALGAAWLPEFIDNRALAGIYDPIGYAHRLGRKWVKTASAGPALLAFHATAAHFPGDPVFPFYRKFVASSEPLARRLRMFFSPIDPGAAGSWTQAGAEGLYDELQSQADAQLGILLSALKEHGLYDEATIVVFSDHGESFHADFPELAGATPVHGARLSEEENHIVLAVKLPRSHVGGPPPAHVDSLVRLIDVGPTLLDLAGQPALEHADGRSLVPFLRGEPLAPLRLYAETGFTHASPDVFDPDHLKGAERNFEAYRVREDGAVEMTEAAHEGSLREKDIGAFDGRSWFVRSPRRDGTLARTCKGPCDDPDLWMWLGQVAPEPGATND